MPWLVDNSLCRRSHCAWRSKIFGPPALRDILEKCVRELGRPLGGQRVDCSELKVESNHRIEPSVVAFVGLQTLTLMF